MNLRLPALLLMAALSASAAPADLAQDPDDGRPVYPPGSGPQDPGGPPPPPNRLFEAIDADDDGELSPKEVAGAAQAIAKLDRNKDGIITEDEVRPPPPPRGRRGLGGPPPPRRPGPPGDDEDHGRPVEAVARELGVTPEKFREVFKQVRPAGPGRQPTEAQRQRNRKVLSEGLGVSPERLDEVMDKYRPGGKVGDGPPR